jgi:hypothetical protein
LTDHLENSVEPLNLPLGLVAVIKKSPTEFVGLRGVSLEMSVGKPSLRRERGLPAGVPLNQARFGIGPWSSTVTRK